MTPRITLVPRLLTEKEVADRCALSVRTLQQWRIRGGGPPYVKLGGAVRYREADLDRWVEGCNRSSTADTGDRHLLAGESA